MGKKEASNRPRTRPDEQYIYLSTLTAFTFHFLFLPIATLVAAETVVAVVLTLLWYCHAIFDFNPETCILGLTGDGI